MYPAGGTAPIQSDLRLQRVITYLNWLIALALLLLLGAAWWWAWRPLPKTSGEIGAPVSQAATVTRDGLGVPHIRAANIDDAIFLQGYVTAQDRLWQMDALRRYASGELSAVIGKATLEADIEARRLRMRRIAEEQMARLSPDDRRWLVAYARGVNHYLETHSGPYPIEFRLLGYEPRPWSVVDTLAIGLQMYRDLTSSWKSDLSRASVLSSGDRRLLPQLFPGDTPLAHEAGSLAPDAHPGSNAWAVSGKFTASGKPILASDPHLEYGLPSTWYMVHLQAPGLNVSGVSLPGVPAVIIGHNERIAWGMTNLQFDVQDLYVERLNAQSGQYVVNGQVQRARPERDLIVVKGGAPVVFNNWVTRHGPVWTLTGTEALALRWTAAEPGIFGFPFVQIDRAGNWTEFRNALRRFGGPGQNFVYADVDGNIGYQATGALPIRRNFDGSTPVDGASGQFEWVGFIPFDDLPSLYNPPEGRIISANQSPFPRAWKYPVSGNFDPGYRAHQIRDLLGARTGLKPEDMLTIQKDVYSPFLHFLAQQVVRTKGADPQATELLKTWNGQMDKDGAAPMIAALLYQQLRTAIAKRAAGRATAWDSTLASSVIQRLLEQRPKEWFSNWDEALNTALREALEEGRRLQGRNPAVWKYGTFNSIELKHPVVSQIPWIGAYFNIGPVAMSGSSTTVKQTTQRLGPSMRFVADLSDWDRSLNNITIGQSGHILSGHYRDQWKSYWTGTSFPMRWKNPEGDVLRVAPSSTVTAER